MDFSLPELNGVDDLQVLHRQLVIVCNDYTLRARRRAYESRKAELEEIKARRGNKWSIHKQYDEVLRQAFVETYDEYERLDDPAFFRIESPDDPDYQSPKPPARVTRFCTSRGNFREYHLARERESTNGNYLANYSYLHLSAPLKSGRRYRLTQQDGRGVSFVFDEDRTVSRAIKVNQSGYVPRVKRKFAYLGGWEPGGGPVDFSEWENKRFDVVNADGGATVHTGTIRLLAKNPLTHIQRKEQEASGEDLYELDLSGLEATGQFYLRIPGVGRSWPFLHGPEAAGRAFYIHLRGLWHQRAGHALDEAYTAWSRPLAHASAHEADYVPTIPYFKPPVSDFEAIRQTGAPPETLTGNRRGVGGWYDAADYDRRWFHYHVIWDLLLAYEIAPENFSDGQAHTYESANGIPDLLDEVAWGLLIWKNSQRGDGGVSSRCEQTRHPSTVDQKPDGMPQHDPNPMYFSQPTREGSLRYAAAAAHLSRLLRPFDTARAEDWLTSARRAYAFGIDPANTFHRDDYAKSGKPFTEPDEPIAIALALAGLDLYLATKDTDYLDEAVRRYPDQKKHQGWPVRFPRDTFWWALYDDPAIPGEIRTKEREEWIALADQYEGYTHQPFYRGSIADDDAWGTAWGKAIATYNGRYLAMGYALTRDEKYLDALALCTDFVQGCNPLGVSWTSGLGYNYPWCFFDAESEEDGILDPVPGLTVYSVVGGLPIGVRTNGFDIADYDGRTREITMLKKLQPESVGEIPYWRRFVQDYHDSPGMQEFTVWETMSPNVLATGILMGTGWRPDESLKNRQPRDAAHLFGQWMTP